MITSTFTLKIEYERTRLGRYGDTRQNVFYSQVELGAACESWATQYAGKREMEWDDYCDVRDRVPRGTNAAIRRHKAKDNWSH